MDWASVITAMTSVALRKESVDRNTRILAHDGRKIVVALRKESVDRNAFYGLSKFFKKSRSPQGERG